MMAFKTGLRMMPDQLLVPIYIIVSCLFVAAQSNFFESVNYSDNRQCTANSACNEAAGERCHRVYDGCLHGRCMCDPRTEIRHDGKCTTVKFGGAACNSSEICHSPLKCIDGTCQCTGNKRPTKDNRFCLAPNEKLLGDDCKPGNDECYHKSATLGYVAHDAHCHKHKHKCTCTAGYKHSGISCLLHLVGDSGCRHDYNCQGGALCRGGICECPTGYYAVRERTKCAKLNALTDLPLGRRCDELAGRRYCEASLICKKCKNDGYHVCLRYRWQDVPPRSSSPATMFGATTSRLHASLLVSFLCLWFNAHWS